MLSNWPVLAKSQKTYVALGVIKWQDNKSIKQIYQCKDPNEMT
jgi:hypothetical protein